MFGFCEESGESKSRAERKRRDRMIDLLLEALGLHPSLSDDELFTLCQERKGPCTFLTSFAQRKEDKRNQDLE
eukprot:9991469-Alexandrium_andersonii.AAC.1